MGKLPTGRVLANITTFQQKKGEEGALFGIFIDPTKCKGCAECVEVCDALDYHALKMTPKNEKTLPRYRSAFNLFRKIGPTPDKYINERALADFMLAEESALLYVGGAGSCMGCGEATAIRMMLAATGFVYKPDNIGIVASTGCNTVYGSTYPYNPYLVPWTNSLFENGPATRDGDSGALGSAGLAGESSSGLSAATARCTTSVFRA